MKKSRFLCTAAALCAAAGLSAADWRIKDGTGSLVLKDSSPDKIDLKIATPDTVTWAREDDRSFFLNFAGGQVTGPAEKLLFPEGLVLEVDFSPDLKSGKEWLPLVTCGNTFQSGYSVWVRKNGTLLVCFPGTGKWYVPIKAGLKNLVDYNLKIIRGENRCVVLLDGKVVADYVSRGKVKNTPGEPFRLGSTPKWKFYGNIYRVRITPFRKGAFKLEKKIEKKLSGNEIVEITDVPDPEGTVVVTDFDKFEPAPTDARNFWSGKWLFRRSGMFPAPSKGVLHCCDNPDGDDIVCTPKLKGKYDVYLGLRATYNETDLMVSLPGLAEKLRVRILPVEISHGKHANTEVLLARDVQMDGGKIVFHPGGFMYLGYIKFIPSANRRKKDYPKWECVSVTPEKRTYRQIWDQTINSLIAKRYYIERKFVDDKKPPVPSAASEKLGCIVTPHDWMDLLFENAVPAKDPGKVVLKAKAAPDEFEPACLAVYGLRDLDKVSLSGGEDLAKAGITSEITVVRSLPKRTTNIYGPSEFIMGPQYLERTQETSLKKGASKLFWITLKVGKDVKPGTYKGSFTLKTPAGEREIPAAVTVRPLKLDPVLRETIAIAGNNYEHTPNRPKYLADHGCNGLGLDIDRDFRRTAKGIDVEHSVAVKVIEYMKKHGLNMIRINLHGLSVDCFRKGNDELFRQSLKDIMAYAAKHDWPPVYFYTMDEVLSNPHSLKAAQWEMENIKAVGGRIMSSHIWYKTTRKFQKEAETMSEKIDLFHNRFSTRKLWYVDSWEEMMARCKKEGKKLSSYNIDNAILFAQPAMKRFSSGWFFRTLGRDAHQQWHFHWHKTNRSPYTDLDGKGECVDWCYDYPAGRGHKGGFPIDFEGVREGVDDLRYITTLENRIAEAKKKGLADAAAEGEKVLTDLKKSFDFGKNFVKNSVFLDSHFEKSWEGENGDRFCSGRYNLPNGWRFEDYHKAREKIASEIIKLDKAMGK